MLVGLGCPLIGRDKREYVSPGRLSGTGVTFSYVLGASVWTASWVIGTMSGISSYVLGAAGSVVARALGVLSATSSYGSGLCALSSATSSYRAGLSAAPSCSGSVPDPRHARHTHSTRRHTPHKAAVATELPTAIPARSAIEGRSTAGCCSVVVDRPREGVAASEATVVSGEVVVVAEATVVSGEVVVAASEATVVSAEVVVAASEATVVSAEVVVAASEEAAVSAGGHCACTNSVVLVPGKEGGRNSACPRTGTWSIAPLQRGAPHVGCFLTIILPKTPLRVLTE